MIRLPVAAVALLAAMAAAAPATAEAASSRGAPVIYADSGSDYSVVLKAEAGRLFVMAASVRAYCSEDEAESAPPARSFYNGFPAPRAMHRTRRGFVAGEDDSDRFGTEVFSVVADFERGRLVGKLHFELREEGFYCESGGLFEDSSAIEFAARRYAPVDSSSDIPHVNSELPIYFYDRGPLEVLLRSNFHHVSVRGSVISRCLDREGRVPLFGSIAVARRSDDGLFAKRTEPYPRHPRHGVRVDEAVSIRGDVSRAAIDGSYLRAQSRLRDGALQSRCRTGPLHFHAVRYLPVRR